MIPSFPELDFPSLPPSSPKKKDSAPKKKTELGQSAATAIEIGEAAEMVPEFPAFPDLPPQSSEKLPLQEP